MSKRSEDPDFSGLKCNESPDFPKLKNYGNPELTRFFKIPYLLLIFFVLIVFNKICFSQEDPFAASKWYYCQRSYPFDTIPWGAYGNAVTQKNDLLQRIGYKLQGSDLWREIGPKPLINGNVDYGGRIRQITYDQGDPTGNSIYIVGQGGGLWETTDGGLNWQNCGHDLPCLYGGTFAISYVNNSKILYFGTGDLSSFRGLGEGLGIFKSTNNGINWIPINSGMEPITTINKIAVSPNDPNTIFAATFHGLYKTTNDGVLWSKIIPEEDEVNLICSDVCFSPDNGSKVYAVGPSAGNSWPWNYFDGIGFWRSDDGGGSFDPVQANGFPHSSNLILSIICGVSKADDAQGYLWFNSFEGGNTRVYVYKSTDYGSNFTPYDIGDNSTSRYHLLLRPSDVNKNICFAGATDLSLTQDGGSNWGGSWAYHPDYIGMDFNPFDPSGMKLMVGNDGGVFSSTDLGSSWLSCNQNIGSMTLLWSCASSTYDANFVAGGLHDYGQAYSQNVGPYTTSWNAVDFGFDGGNMTSSPFRSKHFACEKVYNRSFRYSSDGISYSDPNDYDQPTTSCPEYAPFTQHPTQPGVVFTVRSHNNNSGNTDLRKSTNYGANWGGNGTPFRTIQKPSAWGGVDINFIAISPSSPNIMVMDYGQVYEFFQNTYSQNCRLIKSTNGGTTWEGIDYGVGPIVTGGQNGTPDRCFTDVEFDLTNENILYLTVSGYYYPSTNQGHVFRSVDGGYNWSNISNNLPSGNNLPDVPVNHLLVHYTGTGINDKELLVATDAGIYVSNASNLGWQLLGEGFPNTMAFHLDYNRLSGKLRANTWGRGAWEFQLDRTVEETPGPIYVQDRLFITDNVTLRQPIVVCSGGKLIIGHSAVPDAFTINFETNANILVMNGGQIDASSGVSVNLTSSGNWDGIEIQGNGYGTLKNCTFNNTETPIVIDGGDVGGSNSILVSGCTFNEGSITVNGRDNVTISKCTTNTASASTATAISANYCDNLVISENEINESWGGGILISNSSPVILKNTIIQSLQNNTGAGISLDNSYSATIKENVIDGYSTGIFLLNSSPVMLENTVTTLEYSTTAALYTSYLSYPRLHPTFRENETIWDGGLNILKSTNNGSGIFLSYSEPDIDYGNNEIDGYQFYMYSNDPNGIELTNYYMRCNTWGSTTPDPNKFNIVNRVPIYEPYGNCSPPGGSGKSSSENEQIDITGERPEPPQPIIIDYGNGIYDTIRVSSNTVEVTADKLLYSQANHNELLGNYSTAFGLYQQIIQNYQDSLSAKNSLRRLMQCRDKMPFDSANYFSLRSYYVNLSQQNESDTSFSKVADELAVKCLVRLKNYPGAITEYENVAQNSTDSLEVLCSELNIIETYLIMAQEGDAQFTGRNTQLKPRNRTDGFRMIREKLFGKLSKGSTNTIPLQYSLSQNYPNPFNPITKIKFGLPKDSKVNIVIYDILGREVKRLVNNEFKSAGSYIVQFNGSNYASGVYFYRIEAEELNGNKFVQSKKMVLIK